MQAAADDTSQQLALRLKALEQQVNSTVQAQQQGMTAVLERAAQLLQQRPVAVEYMQGHTELQRGCAHRCSHAGKPSGSCSEPDSLRLGTLFPCLPNLRLWFRSASATTDRTPLQGLTALQQQCLVSARSSRSCLR